MVLRRDKSASALSWLWLSLVVVVLDQVTKFWALEALAPAGLPHPVIPGFLNWTLAFNTGAAFSFLATGSGWQRWFFVLLAVVISIALATWLKKTPRGDWKSALPLALVIGGAGCEGPAEASLVCPALIWTVFTLTGFIGSDEPGMVAIDWL